MNHTISTRHHDCKVKSIMVDLEKYSTWQMNQLVVHRDSGYFIANEH